MTTIKSREEIEREIREEIKAANRAYKREWRKRNPDKIKAANERYYLKKAAELIAKRGIGHEESN